MASVHTLKWQKLGALARSLANIKSEKFLPGVTCCRRLCFLSYDTDKTLLRLKNPKPVPFYIVLKLIDLI